MSNTVSSPKIIDNIQYQVKVCHATEHLFAVSMSINIAENCADDLNFLVVALPAWIPGSYMIRDFAKNLHCLRADNAQISITQLDKQRWQLDLSSCSDKQKIVLNYQVYAFDLSVRSAFINDEYAFFNGTSVFLHVQDHEDVEHFLSIESDETDNTQYKNSLLPNIVSAMPIAENQSNRANKTVFKSADYFELIDHPVLIGQFDDYCFDVMGHRFHLVFSGQHPIDFPQLELDLTAIIEHHINLFGDFPCKEYWFMTLVCDNGFGGLEHMASTVLQYSRFELPLLGADNSGDKKSASYRTFLSLCSHELFHTWHVKRIKPELMHKPNLLEEVYTPQLWIYEGFTSFYDDLSLARAGVISPKQYADVLSEAITRLLRNTGRHKQSVSASSFEAWSKFYKQDAGSVNHIVSYYNKGAIVALCLDLTLRQQSSNKVSLDNVMQTLWSQYGKTNIGTKDDVIETLCIESFGLDIKNFIHMATKNTMDMPLPSLLQGIGLHLKMRSTASFDDKGGSNEGTLRFDIGANLSDSNGFIKVNSVFEARAASQAGLQVGDTIVAFNHFQCDLKKLNHIMEQAKLDETYTMHVLRDGRMLTLRFNVIPAVNDTCELSIAEPARFKQWLGVD